MFFVSLTLKKNLSSENEKVVNFLKSILSRPKEKLKNQLYLQCFPFLLKFLLNIQDKNVHKISFWC